MRLPCDMSSVLDIIGGLFKSLILDSTKGVQIADWCCWVTSVSETSNRNFLRGLEGNRIRKKPSGLLKALDNLILTPNKDHVYWVSICPRLCLCYFGIGGEIIGVGVKTYEYYNNSRFAHFLTRFQNCNTLQA